MDVHASPYLEAIQAVAGCTPGQKYKELNSIAKRAASDAKSHGDAVDTAIGVRDVPEPLLPLVTVEIAKMLRQSALVADALKSEDCKIVDRALRADWFFAAENVDYANVEYFATYLYPAVSLNTRIKLIKRLVASFGASGDTDIAESFYSRTAEIYGKSQAEPLLVACAESFVWDAIKKRNIVLSCRMIKQLFVKYPELVVRYLKLSVPKRDDIDTRESHRVDIYKYKDFLPRLIKNHLSSLVELIDKHESCLGIKLSNKATERFIKSNVDVVLERPKLYASMMPLKLIAAKITKSQYRCMFARIYPPKIRDFRYCMVEEYLEYYPENERTSLLLETYESVYNESILDNNEVINEKILQLLPADERARQARIKLVKEPDWRDNRWNIEKIWRCYLPLDETLSTIMTEISKTSLSNDRSSLIRQMFFVCKINDDKEALLRVLRYFTTRHKNERSDFIFDVLGDLVERFDMSNFGNDHWSIIDDFMKFLYVKNEIMQSSRTSRQIIASSTHFKLSHDLPIDDNIEMLIDINTKGSYDTWRIFEKYPEYDRITLERMICLVPQKYPQDSDIWSKCGNDVVRCIVKSICDFNNRNTGKASGLKMEKMSIKCYEWLLVAVEKISKANMTGMEWKLDCIINYLKIYEIDLYELWFPAKLDVIGDMKTGEALKFLKEDSRKILQRCDDYFKSIISSVGYEEMTRRFVKACRWYQDIPMKFLENCLERLRNDKNEKSLIVLAILMNGEEFSRVIEPLVPANETSIDTSSKAASSIYEIISTIPRAMNLVNPPVSLNLVLSFCQGEYLNLGLVSLTNASRRCTVDKIEKFTKQLADCRVSVKKHGIRLFCLVATVMDYRNFLSIRWKTEEHRSIRGIIFNRIYGLFVDEPCTENWNLLCDCMKDLRIDDEDDILDRMANFNDIPNYYIVEYVPLVFKTLETLESNGLDDKRMAQQISRFLDRINESTSKLMTEEFSEILLKKYFCSVGHSSDVVQAGMKYTLYSYLRAAEETKLARRLEIFGKLYIDILTKYWNKPDASCKTYFPINWMTHEFVNRHVYNAGIDSINVKIMITILKSFTAVLAPQNDWTTYAMLIYGIALEDSTKTTSLIAEKIVAILPRLVEKLSPVLVLELANIVKKWLKRIVDGEEFDNAMYRIIEILCHVSTLDSCTMAAKLLFRSNDRQYDERCDKIVEFLKNSRYPIVVSLAFQHVNTWDLPK